jgi:hypothetical protein
MNRLFKFSSALIFVAAAASVQAATPLYAITSPLTSGNATYFGTYTISQVFTLNDSYNVAALGLIDSGSGLYDVNDLNGAVNRRGFYFNHNVSLINSSNQVIRDVTFLKGDDPVTSGSYGPGTLGVSAPPTVANPNPSNIAQFRYLDVVPITLTAGTYQLVSSWDYSNYRDGLGLNSARDTHLSVSRTSTTASFAAGAALGVATYSVNGGSNGLISDGSVRAPRIIAANVLLEAVPVSPVPEPAEWAMMVAGLATVGAIAKRRRKS